MANLILQLGILPLDPLAYAMGVFTTLGSFVPNTVLHVMLASGFAYYLAKMKRPHRTPPTTGSAIMELERLGSETTRSATASCEGGTFRR